MEELNKTQLILLALLVSFVTSIATGIVTVTLMDQAPQGVTQTINRVVKKTERIIVPQKTNEGQSAHALLAAETELIARIAEERSRYVVLLSDTQNIASSTGALSRGTIVKRDILLAPAGADARYAHTSDGTAVPLVRVSEDEHRGIAMFAASSTKPFVTNELAMNTAPRVGQTIVSLTRNARTPLIRRGLLSGVDADGDADVPALVVSMDVNNYFNGGALFDLDGMLIGVILVADNGTHRVIPAAMIQELISAPAQSDDSSQGGGSDSAEEGKS